MPNALPRKHIRFVALGVALTLMWSFLSAPLVEANFWKERQLNKNNPIESADAPARQKFLETLKRLPYRFGSVRPLDKSIDPAKPIIVLVQDAHAVPSAQRNIANILDYIGMASVDGPVLIGLEGAFGPLDLDPYRKNGRPENVQIAAEYLLSRKRINGTEYHAMVAAKPPILWGVETPSLYERNVQAYLDERPFKLSLEERINSWNGIIESVSPRLLSGVSLEIENDLRAFTSGRLSLVDFIRRLDRAGIFSSQQYPNLARLTEISRIEAKFSIERIQAERQRLVEELMEKSSKSDRDELLSDAVKLRDGLISNAQYSEKLEGLASRAQISLKDMPAIANHLLAVRLTAGIDHESLLRELSRAIDSRQRLVPAGPARELLRVSDDLQRLRLMTQNQLSPDQWREYVSRRAEILNLPGRLSRLSLEVPADDSGLAKLVAPFERFYQAAEARNRALSDNLLAKARLSGAHSAVLVAGGFHTEGVKALLSKMDVCVVIVTPAMDPDRINSQYLESFTRELDSFRQPLSASRSTLALMASLNSPETSSMARVIVGALDALEKGDSSPAGIVVSRDGGKILARDPRTGVQVLAGELPDIKTIRDSMHLPVIDLFHIPNSKNAMAVLGAAKRFWNKPLLRTVALGAALILVSVAFSRPEWIGGLAVLGVVAFPGFELSGADALRGDGLRAELSKAANRGVMDYKMLKWRQLFHLTGRTHWEADLEQRILPGLRKAAKKKDKAALAQGLVGLLLIAGLGGSGKTTVLSVFEDRINAEIDGLVSTFFSTDNVLLEKKKAEGEPGLPPPFPGLDRDFDKSGQPTEFPMKKFQAHRVSAFLRTAVKGGPFNAPIFDQASRGRDRLCINDDGFVVAVSRKSQFVLDQDVLRRLRENEGVALEFPLGSLNADVRLEGDDVIVRVLETDHRLVNYAKYLKAENKSSGVTVLVKGELPQVLTKEHQGPILQTIDARGKLLIVEGIFAVLDEELMKGTNPPVMAVILYVAYNVRRLRMVERGKGQARDQNSEALAEQRDWLTIIEERVLQRYIEAAKKLDNVREVNAMDDEEAVLALYWLGKLSHLTEQTAGTLKQLGFADPENLFYEIQQVVKKELADRFWNLNPTPQMQSSRFAHYPMWEIFNKVYMGTEAEQVALSKSVNRLLESMGGLMTPTAHQVLETPRFVNVVDAQGVSRRMAVHDLYSQEKAIPLKDFLKLMVDWGELEAAQALILRLFSLINDSARRGIVVDPRWMEKYGIIMRGNEQLVAIGLDGSSEDIEAYDRDAYLDEKIYLYTSDERDMGWFEPLKEFYLEHARNKKYLPSKERFNSEYGKYFGPTPDKYHWVQVPAPVDWRLDAKILREVINPRSHPENLKVLKKLWLKSRGPRAWERLLWVQMYFDVMYARGTRNFSLVEKVYRELTDHPELAELSLEELQSQVSAFLEDEWRRLEGKDWTDISKPLPPEAEQDLSRLTVDLTRYAELPLSEGPQPPASGAAMLFGLSASFLGTSVGGPLANAGGTAAGNMISVTATVLPDGLWIAALAAIFIAGAVLILRKKILSKVRSWLAGAVSELADADIAIVDASSWETLSAEDQASYLSGMAGFGKKGTVILLTKNGQVPGDIVNTFKGFDRSETGGNLIVVPWRETAQNAFVLGSDGRASLDAQKILGIAMSDHPDLLEGKTVSSIVTFTGQDPWNSEGIPEQTNFLLGKGGHFYRIPIRWLSQYFQWQWGVQRFIEQFA